MKKRHHTIPEFYLRRFAVPSSNSGEPEGFWVYRRGEGTPRWLPPESVSIHKHFYSRTDESGKRDSGMEDLLQDLESAVAPIICRVTSSGLKLDSRETVRLAFFVATMYTRTAKHRRNTVQIMERRALAALKALADDEKRLSASLAEYVAEKSAKLNTNDVRRGIEGMLSGALALKLNDSGQLAYSLAPTAELCEQALQMDWAVIVAPPGTELVTSDSRVVVGVPHDQPIPTSWATPGVEVTLPLDPGHCLLLTCGSPAGGWPLPSEYVSEIVRRTALRADREVYAPHKNAIVAKTLR